MSKFGRTTSRKSAGGYVRKWWKAFFGPRPGFNPGGTLVITRRVMSIMTSG